MMLYKKSLVVVLITSILVILKTTCGQVGLSLIYELETTSRDSLFFTFKHSIMIFSLKTASHGLKLKIARFSGTHI